MIGLLRGDDVAVWHVRKRVVPLAVSRRSTAELIERLPQVEGFTDWAHPIGRLKPDVPRHYFHSADLDFVFLPVVSTWGLTRDGKRVPPSPIVVELIARGLDSVPLLLEHLTDARPTRCLQTVRFMIGGPVGFADQYDARDRSRRLARDKSSRDRDVAAPTRSATPGVNRIGDDDLRPIPGETYTLRVGDLCYYCLGQIVNRHLWPVGGGTHYIRTMTINSPVEFPALAVAACADWGRLTAAEHCASLLADAQQDDTPVPFQAGEPGLCRLLFYYPSEGIMEAERRLSEPLTSKNLPQREPLIERLAPFEWATRQSAFKQLARQAMALPADDTGQRFRRDHLVLQLIRSLPSAQRDPAQSRFLAQEIRWWEGWQQATAAQPWFNQGGPMAVWSNLFREVTPWIAEAKVFSAGFDLDD